jgi:hypothetical protein
MRRICLLGLLSLLAWAQEPSLADLAKEDQEQLKGGPRPARSDEDRIRIVLQRLASGEVKSGKDRLHAGLILQHTPLEMKDGKLRSKSADNYLLAHYLFLRAMAEGESAAKYLAAASMDRYLSFTEGIQKYGTNRVIDQKTEEELLVPVDRNTSDEERARFGVPPLKELLRRYKEQDRKAP